MNPLKFLNFIIVGGFVIEKLKISWRKQSGKLRPHVNTSTFTKLKQRWERKHQGDKDLRVCFVHAPQRPQQCMKQGQHTINISWMLNSSWKADHVKHQEVVKSFLIQKMMLIKQFFIYFFVLSQKGNTITSVKRSFWNIFKICIVLVHSLNIIKAWAMA